MREYDPDLPKDPRTLLHTGKIGKPRTLLDGQYCHFGIKNGLQSKLSIDPQLQLKSKGELLQLNVDGLPLFKSMNEQFWPIVGTLVEAARPQPFVIGLFSGKSNVDEFLKDFVEEMGLEQCRRLASTRRPEADWFANGPTALSSCWPGCPTT